jgi:hypothetical protein
MAITQVLGNYVDELGRALNLPEWGISENIAGGTTTNTYNPVTYVPPTQTQVEYLPKTVTVGTNNPVTTNTSTGGTPTQPTSPSPTQPSTNNGIPTVDMSFYPGWNDQNAINMDWANTWQQKLGQSSGGSSGPSMEEIRQQQLALINDRYNQNEGLLNQQEQNLRDVYPQQEQEINDSYSLASQRALNTFDTTNSNLKNQEIRTRQDQEKMLDSARRLYNELTMGVNQRFGGASGAGEFAKAILGSEFQRTMGANRQTTYDQISQINQKKIDFEKEYQYSNQQLELEKKSAIRELGYSFKDKLFQIQSDRSKNLQMKQAEEFDSLKSYASELQAVNARAQELQQSLILQKDKMESQFQYELQLINAKAQNASQYESPNWKVSQYEDTPFFYNSKGQVQAINPSTVGVVKDEEEEEKGFLDWLK